MKPSKPWLRCLCGVLLLGAALTSAAQENFPQRPITVVIPVPPGGFADIIGRAVSAELSDSAKVSMIVENRPGAIGVVALSFVARAKPDGYTVGICQSGAFIAVLMSRDAPLDMAKDLAPVAMAARIASAYVVAADSRYSSLAQIIADAKARPGVLNVSDIGGGGRIMLKRIEDITGARFTAVPYASGSAAVTALLGKQIDVTLDTIGSARQMAASGKVRVLAVTSPKASPELPGVPPVSDVVPGVSLESWYGYVAPSATPAGIIGILNRQLNLALRGARVHDVLDKLSVSIAEGSPEDFGASLRAEADAYLPVIKKYNLAN